MWILTLSLVFSAKRKAFRNITTTSLYFIFPRPGSSKYHIGTVRRNCRPKKLKLIDDT